MLFKVKLPPVVSFSSNVLPLCKIAKSLPAPNLSCFDSPKSRTLPVKVELPVILTTSKFAVLPNVETPVTFTVVNDGVSETVTVATPAAPALAIAVI